MGGFGFVEVYAMLRPVTLMSTPTSNTTRPGAWHVRPRNTRLLRILRQMKPEAERPVPQ